MASGEVVVEGGLPQSRLSFLKEVEIDCAPGSPRMEDRRYPSSLLGLSRVVRFSKLLPSMCSLRGEGDAGELASEGSILRVVGYMEGHW